MKKLLALLLALMMLFSVATVFAGCEDSGKKKTSSSQNDDDEDEEDDEEQKNDDKNEDENNGENGDVKSDEEDDLTAAKAALRDYFDVAYYGDADKLESSAPQEFWDTISSDFSISDLKSAMPDYIADMGKMAEEEVGGNYYVKIVVTNYTSMDDEALDEYVDALKDDFGIDSDLVEDGCILTCDMIAGGDDSEETMPDNEMYMICYDGTWYPVYCRNYEDIDGNSIFYCEFSASDLVSTLAYYMD